MPGQLKNLLAIEPMEQKTLLEILDTAKSMKEVLGRAIKRVPTLNGKTVLMLFYEPSTRTKASFSLACKYLSAGTESISTSMSSIKKGETLLDTVRNIEVMGVDAVVMRHSMAGAAEYLADRIDLPVLNAGDGMHEHPTQALLDLYTLREERGAIEGQKVVIIGDIAHSRVARSNIWGLKKLGAQVVLAGPPTMLPPHPEEFDVEVTADVEEGITDADVIYMLRIQRERQQSALFPSEREYHELYGLNARRLELAKPDATVMHPGPMNRGVEITSDIADSSRSVILDQAQNGVAVRMAILYKLLGGGE